MSTNTILASAPLTSTGYHLKANGTTLGNSLIWDNGTNVGIGNTNTSYTLDVTGTGRFTGNIQTANIQIGGTGKTSGWSQLNLADYNTGGSVSGVQIQLGSSGTNFGVGFYGSNFTLGLTNNGTSITSQFLNITQTGNVGIGTSSPNKNSVGKALTVNASSGNSMYELTTGDSSTTAYWEYTGTDSSIINVANGYLRLGTNNTERMHITSGGQIFMATTAAFQNNETLCVLNSGTTSIFSKQDGGFGAWVQKMWNNATSGDNKFCEFLTESTLTARGSITYNRGAGLTVFNTTSDYRLKSEISDFNALEIIANLKPKEFRIGDAKNKSIGFIAHELQEYLPQAVSGEKDAIDKEGNPNYQGVDYSQLTGLLTKAIQEQQAQIQSLQEQINILAK